MTRKKLVGWIFEIIRFIWFLIMIFVAGAVITATYIEIAREMGIGTKGKGK